LHPKIFYSFLTRFLRVFTPFFICFLSFFYGFFAFLPPRHFPFALYRTMRYNIPTALTHFEKMRAMRRFFRKKQVILCFLPFCSPVFPAMR